MWLEEDRVWGRSGGCRMFGDESRRWNRERKIEVKISATVRRPKAAGLGAGLNFLCSFRARKAAGLKFKAAGCWSVGLFRPPALAGLYAGLSPLFHPYDLFRIQMFPISYHYLLYHILLPLNPIFKVSSYTHIYIYISLWVWVAVSEVEIVIKSDEMTLRVRGVVRISFGNEYN